MTNKTSPAGGAPITRDNAPGLAKRGVLSLIDLFNVTQGFLDEGRLADAVGLYQLWLTHTRSPVAYAVHFNLAVALGSLKDDEAAEREYRRAIELNPKFCEAHLNLGTLQERCKRPDEALATWRKILDFADLKVAEQKAFHIQALNNLGRLLEILKRYEEAEEMLYRSLSLDSKQPNVITHFVHLRQKQCHWPVYFDFAQITVADLMASTSALAMLSVSNDPAVQLEAARRFVDEKILKDAPPMASPDGYRHDRLRIGYLSSDFCSHAVSILTAQLYELHDREKVEVYGFCWSNEDGSPLRARVVGAMDHYIRIVDMGDEEAARCIRAHEIDILVDLHGLTLGTRPNILAHRPAPVQVTYLGFPGPTGMPGIDYVIADEFLIPPALAPFYTEKPIYMPHCFQVNDRLRVIGPRPTRAECGLPDGPFVFCSFNNNFKFNEQMFDAWMCILARVPDSILWLVSDHEIVHANLCREAERRGIDPGRLYFAGRAVPSLYLARYQLADLFLDTFPFNAGTTASDALWAGLPLLTYTGNVFAARMAGSLLHAVDLPELITYSLQDYEDKAVALAGQPEKIAAMKRQLEENRLTCHLFDSPQFVRDLEEKFFEIARGRIVPRAELALAAPAGPVLAPAPAPAARVATPLAATLPVVSIVIPSYKPAHFEQCLKSAIGQTYPHIEILVSDNCPTEEIRDICKKYNNVIYQRSSVIRGDNVLGALFSGKGTYIKPLFDDDILHPFCVERMVSVMLRNEPVELVFSASRVIDIDNMLSEQRRPYTASGSMRGTDMQRSMALRFGNFVGEFTSVMFKRQKIWDLGWKSLFTIADHDFGRGLADIAFFCNVARDGAAFYIDEELSYFRQDERLMSNSNISANPDFGYCFSDYIDLAIVSHKTGVISDAELQGLRLQVETTVQKFQPVFHQMGEASARYFSYVAALGLA